jgi:hypothetical protein
MKSDTSKQSDAADNVKWGYAIAGAIALGFAAVIQVAFGGLDEETLAKLPAVVAVPYGIAGKLGITVPLALLGIGLILRDAFVNLNVNPQRCRTPRRERTTAGAIAQKGRIPAASGEVLEVGEPIPEEMSPAPPAPKKPAGKKIAALQCQFDGRATSAKATTGGPVDDTNTVPQRPGGGSIVLTSEKFMRRKPSEPGDMRRGRTHHTTDE